MERLSWTNSRDESAAQDSDPLIEFY